MKCTEAEAGVLAVAIAPEQTHDLPLTRLHTGRWSFEQAVKYFMEAGGGPDDELDRRLPLRLSHQRLGFIDERLSPLRLLESLTSGSLKALAKKRAGFWTSAAGGHAVRNPGSADPSDSHQIRDRQRDMTSIPHDHHRQFEAI